MPLATFPHEASRTMSSSIGFSAIVRFFFDRPDAIRRILVENSAYSVQTAPTIRVLSPLFGYGLFLGPRVCIGAQFALTELVLLLAIVSPPFGPGLLNLASSDRSGSSVLSRLIRRPSCCSFAGSRAPRRFVPSQRPFPQVESCPYGAPQLGITN